MRLIESTVTIVGAGLMGGSLGKALMERHACKEVRAVVRRREAAQQVVAINAAHWANTDVERLVSDSDLVVLATPVRTIEKQVADIGRFMKDNAVMTDMGSVKRNIVKAMRKLPSHVSAIGGHPMCGKETSGLGAADPNLFQGKKWVLTPLENSDGRASELVAEMATSVGAQVVIMKADEHDMITASVSHLCYLLASALVSVAEDTAGYLPAVWDLASSGFKDTSRVAASDPTMMMDIIASNRDHVCRMLSGARDHMDKFMTLIENRDDQTLRETLSKVRNRRSAMFGSDE